MAIGKSLKRLLGIERGISGTISAAPLDENKKWSAEEMARLTVENEACIGFGLPDYLYLRDRFIRMTMDIKGLIHEPWYARMTVAVFVQALAHPAVPDVIRIRLLQENKEYEFGEIKSLCEQAEDIFSTLYHCRRPNADSESVERCRSYLERVTLRLLAIDKYFTKKIWPEYFEPRDNHGEFLGTSIETAMMHVPYMN